MGIYGGPSFDIINYLVRWNKDDSKITMKIKGGQGVGESSGGWGGVGEGFELGGEKWGGDNRISTHRLARGNRNTKGGIPIVVH